MLYCGPYCLFDILEDISFWTYRCFIVIFMTIQINVAVEDVEDDDDDKAFCHWGVEDMEFISVCFSYNSG